MDLEKALEEKLTQIDKAMDVYISKDHDLQKIIYESMRYSVFAGGKRLRPILALAACEFVGGNTEKVIPFACALEMIHTYSLIHDDLPAMDNDDYRRGKLTNHKVYGDGLAVLAGDALLNLAFETMLRETIAQKSNYEVQIIAMSEIASAAGTSGMIGGQVVDLISENKEIDADTLDFIHNHKTGALIRAAVRAGAILGNAKEEELRDLTKYAESIGLGFQITDDILDIIGDEKKLGKKIGRDIEKQKCTYPGIHGLDNSIKKVNELFEEAIGAIKNYGEKSQFFMLLADYLVKRQY